MEHNYTKQSYSNASCAFLSLIPAISSLVYINVFDKNNLSYFKYLSSLSAIVILVFPFIIRNYTNLTDDFDDKICAISCGIIIFKFIHACFTKNYELAISYSYIPIIATMIFDVLALLCKEKKYVFIYKLLNCIALAVLYISSSAKQNFDYGVYAAITIPALIIIYLTDKKNVLSGSMCMLTFYTVLIHCKCHFASLKNEGSVISQIVTGAKKFVFW